MTTNENALWRSMLSRSFSPSQWFVTDDHPGPNGGGASRHDGCDDARGNTGEEDRKMYVYRCTEPGLWTVGYYDPKGEWHPESDWSTPKEAAERVRWLHGGTV